MTNFDGVETGSRQIGFRRPHPVTAVAAALLVLGIAWAIAAIARGVGQDGGGAVASDVASALVDVNVTTDVTRGAGTGIVLTSSGEILTNNHVIRGARNIRVTDVGNGRTYDAEVVGYDAGSDVAVIQLKDASGLETAPIDDSGQAAVGDPVVAIGNAGGTGGAPSRAAGSITALGSSIEASDEVSGTSEQLSGLIQVDADLQPGDSGGALVDGSGRVIGMNAAASLGFSFDSSASKGFAIPIARALAIARQIESGDGTSAIHVGPTAFLGISIAPNDGYSSGAAVRGTVSGAPAEGAGITEGDVITSLDGEPVDSATSLSKLLVPHHPGDSVKVGWADAYGQSHEATVELATGAPA